MAFSDEEQKAMSMVRQMLANFDDAPDVPQDVLERIVLGLRSKALAEDADGLLAGLDSIHPQIAARALRVLQSKSLELADDFEKHTERTAE